MGKVQIEKTMKNVLFLHSFSNFHNFPTISEPGTGNSF